MATARTIITDALKEIGVVAEGETPSGTMADDAFRALNRLLAVLSNDKDFAYSNDTLSRTLTSVASFTIGPTGDLVVARPLRIDSAFVTLNSITYPVAVINSQEWDSIPYKSSTGTVPEVIYYEPLMANGVINLYPISSGGVLYIRTTSLVSSFATLDTALSMPPGYEDCLMTNTAINISPQYPASVISKVTIMSAQRSLKKITRLNKTVPILTIDPFFTNGGSSRVAAIFKG